MLKRHSEIHFFVFLKMKIFNRAERYTFSLCTAEYKDQPSTELFYIFVNDLSAFIKYCQNCLLIDDLKVVGNSSSREACALIQFDLDAMCE